MSLLTPQATLSLEEIQRAAFYLLLDNLNAALAEVEQRWEPSDQEFAERTDRVYAPTTLEPIEVHNFHEGHRPSLIKAPVDRYPNVAVMCFLAVPSPGSDQWDHMNVYRDTLWIEVMAKAGPEPVGDVEGETICNRRAHRLAEAANLCILRDESLGGIVSGHDTAPTIRMGDLFTRKERTSYGPHWYWQGARLEYAVRKEAAASSPSSGSFFRPPIDQAP